MSNTAKTLAERAASEPTELHKNFALWIEERTGVKPDLKTVQLACSMRMDFQRSEENQSHLTDRKAKAAAAKKASAAAKKAKLEAQLAKLKADLDKVETETAPVSTPAVTTAAKKTVARRSSKALDNVPETDAPAKTTRRRPAAKATAPKVTPDVPQDFDSVDLAEPAKPARRTRRTATAPKTA